MPNAFRAVTLTKYGVGLIAAGVPVISPVVELITNPVGCPVMLKLVAERKIGGTAPGSSAFTFKSNAYGTPICPGGKSANGSHTGFEVAGPDVGKLNTATALVVGPVPFDTITR